MGSILCSNIVSSNGSCSASGISFWFRSKPWKIGVLYYSSFKSYSCSVSLGSSLLTETRSRPVPAAPCNKVASLVVPSWMMLELQSKNSFSLSTSFYFGAFWRLVWRLYSSSVVHASRPIIIFWNSTFYFCIFRLPLTAGSLLSSI